MTKIALTAGKAAGMFGFLGNLKVKSKIMLGFACVLALLAAMGGLSYWSLGNVAGDFATYEQRVLVGEISAEIDTETVKLRKEVREFAVTGKPEKAEAARALEVELDEVVAKAVETIKNPERLAKAEEADARRTWGDVYDALCLGVHDYVTKNG